MGNKQAQTARHESGTMAPARTRREDDKENYDADNHFHNIATQEQRQQTMLSLIIRGDLHNHSNNKRKKKQSDNNVNGKDEDKTLINLITMWIVKMMIKHQ